MANHQAAAVIDIGSNTVKLIVGQLNDGGIEVSHEKLVAAKLSQNIDENGSINSVAIEKLNKIINDFHETITKMEVSNVQCIATEAIRKANNGDQILNGIKHLFPQVKQISGKEEAEIIAKIHIQKGIENGILLDIGGGSVEFVLIRNNQIEKISTTPLGTLTLKNKFNIGEKITPHQMSAIQAYVNENIQDFNAPKNLNLYGTEGSFTNLYKAIYKTGIKPFSLAKIKNSNALNQLKSWSKSSKKERLNDPYIDEQRKHVAHIASALLLCIMKEISPNKMIASSMGLKESILHKLLL